MSKKNRLRWRRRQRWSSRELEVRPPIDQGVPPVSGSAASGPSAARDARGAETAVRSMITASKAELGVRRDDAAGAAPFADGSRRG